MTKTAAESFKALRDIKERAEKALKAADVPLIADQILRAGYHPYRPGGGRALLEILVKRHRGQARPPFTPEVSTSDVTELAESLGISRQFDPTRRLEI